MSDETERMIESHERLIKALDGAGQKLTPRQLTWKPNGGNGVTMGLFITILVAFAALGGFLVRDVKEATDGHILSGGHPQLRVEVEALREGMREKETQFRWMADVVNLENAHNDRIMRIVYAKVFKSELPPREFMPLRLMGADVNGRH